MPKIPEKKQQPVMQPTVRLVAANDAGEGGARVIAKAMPLAPEVRLGFWAHQGDRPGMDLPQSPTIKLAHGPGAQGDNVLIGQRGVAAMPDTLLPALLVSFFYLEQFIKNRHRYHYRDWVIDSGAFSAHNSGATIILQEYINCCKQLMVEDPTLTEVYALDVIGDWRGSLKNTEEMWRQGVPAIPCYHFREPWDVLVGMAKDYPKIALGGVAAARGKIAWAQQCFARVWPKKIHGFAFGSERAIMTLPFHSVDATNWELGPCKFGHWKAFGGQRVSVRGSQQNLRAEVEWYLELEQKARVKWKKEMAQLESLTPTIRLALSGLPKSDREHNFQAPLVQLALANTGQGEGQVGQKITNGLAPTVRLAETASGKTEAKIKALEAIANSPTVRLAENGDPARNQSKAAAFNKE